MAKKQNTDETAAVKAAKAIGSATGKIAALAGVTAEGGTEQPPQPRKAKKGKLPKKNKSRLPRKQKKAMQKAARQANR